MNDRISKLYFRFLVAAAGSAVVISIYSFVDSICIGKSESEAGAAAMAVLLPYFAIMSFFAVLCSMGGAVLMSQSFGEGNYTRGKKYYTVSCINMLAVMAVFWTLSIVLEVPIFKLFGASDSLMPKLREYGDLIVWAFPLFVIPNFLGCFVRNDKAPAHVMAAVLTGGAVNIVGDIVFVFPLGMGMRGAGLATVLGAAVQTAVMLTRLLSKKCNLRFVKPDRLFRTSVMLLCAGFSAGILELGTVVISCIMNNQIMRYGNEAYLATYGVISTIAALFQALFSGIGLAVQPITSSNYGARRPARIRKALAYGAVSTAVLAAIVTIVCEIWPMEIIELFMTTTPAVREVAPRMTRLFTAWYVFLGINALGVYYLQSISQSRAAMAISILRSFVTSTLFVYTLPLSLSMDGVMIALPISEAIVSLITVAAIIAIDRKLFRPEELAYLAYNDCYRRSDDPESQAA